MPSNKDSSDRIDFPVNNAGIAHDTFIRRMKEDVRLAAFCPYKGLQPYTEDDRAFFFGRQRDAQIIISNLYAARLTTLYGASGVGKSSVLLAGALPLLRTEPNLAVVVFRGWQDPDFLGQLKKSTLQAAGEKARKEIQVDLSISFDEFLARTMRALRCS